MLLSRMPLTLSRGDLETDVLLTEPELAWDIETSGLEWDGGRVASCQHATRDGRVYIVRIDGRKPARLCRLLADPAVKKVFHYAMFDLRFMCSAWGIVPRNIACTKIASKLLHPQDQDHSLKTLLRRYCEVELDKGARLSDWFADPWSAEQLRYAAEDVSHLLELYDLLCAQLREADLFGLASRCYEHLPTKLELELGRYGDVFTY